MKRINRYFFILIIQIVTQVQLNAQQRVGLVLSGGGAAGLAHIGVMIALEENGIPIDFISGTSAGALTGAMYASGYSPREIEAFVLSDEFQQMTSGDMDASKRFLFREAENHAGTVSFSFSKDSLLRRSIPLNLVRPALLDYKMMRLMGTTSSAYEKDFNKLFVPFRCVASDVVNKKSTVFSSGNLNECVRASMTYPLYVNPIRINGTLYFDGGLYNNFPADVMYTDFHPDFIIGSNVSGNVKAPDEQDFIGVLENMLVSYSNFNLPCAEGIIIEPKSDISTFDFQLAKKAIDEGYRITILKMDSILAKVERRVSPDELMQKRKLFRSKIPALKVSEISQDEQKSRGIAFAKSSLQGLRKKAILNEDKLDRRYFRLYSTSQLDFMFPTLSLKKDSTYNLKLFIRKAKDFQLDLGGHFSSRAVNTGYVGLTYKMIGSVASSLHAESYFGKFYGSVKTDVNIELPSVFPISASAYFVMNRWDYFRSFATFFEDVQPSFLVQNEKYAGFQLKHPLGNNSKSTFNFRYFELDDEYYQNANFTNKDTADLTSFYGSSISWEFTRNSLNRKQFANSGHYFQFKARLVEGRENTVPGTTSAFEETFRKYHSWFNVNTEFQSFIVSKKYFHLGLHAKGQFNSQSLFANYTASLLSLPAFSIIPDQETYFLPEFRSHQHMGGGVNLVFSLRKNVDFRIDAYYYQPFLQLQKNVDGTIQYIKPFKGETFLASSTLVYHSLIGPIRATLNYFPTQKNPFAFQLSYGYVLFNERAIR